MKSLKTSFLYLFVVAIIVVVTSCKTQKDPLVIKIQNEADKVVEKVTLSEFINIYKKNNLRGDSITPDAIKDYMDLFIKYKLKVEEAEADGMDTMKAFISELKGYRGQLAQQYLVDTGVTDSLIREAYARMKFDIRASHILITLPKEPTPEDTLLAWSRINDALKRINNGEDFQSVAMEVTDDPSAKDMPGTPTSAPRKGNKGDIGYFSVFNMVYPFESAAYNTPVGEISNIIRSAYGYHILKVTDKQPAMKKAYLAHIYLKYPESGIGEDSIKVEQKINEIYKKFISGERTYESLAKQYSDHTQSAQDGGKLRWYEVQGLVPQFVETTSKLKIGGVSQPVATIYGWHIIKLIDKNDVGTFKDEMPGIKQRISRDSRANLSREFAVTKIKKQFGFKEYLSNAEDVKSLLDSNVFKSEWKAEIAKGMKKTVVKIGDKKYSQYDLAVFIETHQARTGKGDIHSFFTDRYEQFVEKEVINYKDSKLEDLYPKFKALMKEYRDGILLFDLMNKMVWQKAVEDTTGLKAFYESKTDQYKWEERVDAVVYLCQSNQIAQNVKMMIEANVNQQAIRDSINSDSELNLVVKSGLYEKGDNQAADNVKWNVGVSEITEIDEQFVVVQILEVKPPANKDLFEIRGLMITQYQDWLEKEWIELLRSKYKVEIYYDEFEKLYTKKDNTE